MDYEPLREWANKASPFMMHNGILITDVADGCATASADLGRLSLYSVVTWYTGE